MASSLSGVKSHSRGATSLPGVNRRRARPTTNVCGVRLVTWLERPELAERGIPSARVWPEYNLHGDVFDELWEQVLQTFPQYQFALLADDDVVLAEGHCAPFGWDGEDASLPPGIDAALRAIVAGGPADTLCALAAEVDPDARRQGLARA